MTNPNNPSEKPPESLDETASRFSETDQEENRVFWKTLLLISLAVVALTWIAVRWVEPPCPKRLVIATGSSSGAYHAFAQQYADVLARHDITLEIRETAGSVENLELLRSDDSDISLAIVQGGAESPVDREKAIALASLYLEPVWLFYHANVPLERMTDFSGATIAIGPEGSGTRALATKLLESNGLFNGPSGNTLVDTTPLGGKEAAEALGEGRVHAAFFVVSPNSPLILDLLQTENIRLMNFHRAKAYPPTYPYLSKVTLHEGVLDIEKNVPSQDIDLLAANANLVARSDLHSALIPLLLETAQEVHRSGGVLEEPGTYPSPHRVCLPLDPDARRYFETGRSFLFRMLPFRLAAWLDRMWIVLLPLCTLLLPLFKIFPPLYRWRIRHKIYRWYQVLRDVESKLRNADTHTDFSEDISTLENLDLELIDLSVPLSYMQEFYNLRLHVSFMLDRLNKRTSNNSLPFTRAA